MKLLAIKINHSRILLLFRNFNTEHMHKTLFVPATVHCCYIVCKLQYSIALYSTRNETGILVV